MYIFVLDYEPNRLSVRTVYFCSQLQLKRAFLLYLNYNNIFIVDQIYCLYCYSLLGSSYNMLRCATRIIFFCWNISKNLYCFCVTIIVFLCNNKLYINDQINCDVFVAWILLFTAMIQFVYQFCLNIFCLNKNLSDLYYCITDTIQYSM